MDQNLPSDNVAEITVIGTGGGYGESVIIHIGNGKWIVVDSCLNPNTKKSLPLEYLQNIGIDVKSQVELVICTHWHDDHILGLSQVFEACENSSLSFARTHDRNKFLNFVCLDYKKLEKEASNSSTIEFNKCLKIAQKKKSTIKEAEQDKTLTVLRSGKFESAIIALSPSDKSVQNFNKEISTLIDQFQDINKKIVFEKPNMKSMALLLKLGYHRAILGADLEVSSDPQLGWNNIINNSHSIDDKSTLFKIPHHGSSNGYDKQIWLDLLSINPISPLTPWNKNNKLPKPEMIKKYSEHTSELYMTSGVWSEPSRKKRDRQLEKFMKKVLNKAPQEIKYEKGLIRCRIQMDNQVDSWTVSTGGCAFKVESTK